MSRAIMVTQMLLKKLKIDLPCDPAILLLGMCSKEIKSMCQRHLYFTRAKIQDQYLSVDKWIKKTWCIYTVERCSAIKHNEILSSAAS